MTIFIAARHHKAIPTRYAQIEARDRNHALSIARDAYPAANTITIYTPHPCNFCGALPPIIYDFRTAYGPWGWGCESCWLERRASDKLGTGNGQAFCNLTGEKLGG